MTFLRERLMSAVAGQLGRPHGIVSPFVARALNRGNQKLIKAAVEAAQAPRGGVAADVGFGGGVGLQLQLDDVGHGGVVHGIEIADEMLRRAESKFGSDARLRLSRGSLTELPLDDGSVDALITVNTVYFIADLDAACKELARVLRPGGRAVIGIGDPDVMAQLPFTKHGFTIRPVSEIAAALQNSGLRVEQRRIEDKPIPRHLLIGTSG
jgi:ubiquinone/menaquinone biosynthesis C-methylase UbiE